MDRVVDHRARILIVEDEILVALDLEHALCSSGYSVCGIATDSAEAIALADQIDFALIDVNLRDGRTGPALAARLFREFGVRSLFVTANPGQIGQAPPGSAGCLRKPFDRHMLCGAVQQALCCAPPIAANDARTAAVRVAMSDG